MVTEKELKKVKEEAKKVKVVLIKDSKEPITPNKLGKRDIRELMLQMKYYVEHLENKGLKVVLIKK